MTLDFTKCPITGIPFRPEELKPLTGSFIEYETPFVGRAKVTLSVYPHLLSGDFERFVMAGICKHRALNKEAPVLIDWEFIQGGYKNFNPPLSFEEKAYSFLKHIYSDGGKEAHEFEFQNYRDFALAYADPDEFRRIMNHLENESFISIRKQERLTSEGNILYMGVRLTKHGREEAEKTLPKMPLISLISQEITTGNKEIDETINHARKLFLNQPQTMDSMRSSCETLSFVLEPLREELTSYFTTKDVSDFFNIVNNFDIRHNKEKTKELVYPEQLEWVFYTLLNTIYVYSKIKKRLS